MTLPPGTLSKHGARRRARRDIYYALAQQIEADVEDDILVGGRSYLSEIARELAARGRSDSIVIVREEARRIAGELLGKATGSRRP